MNRFFGILGTPPSQDHARNLACRSDQFRGSGSLINRGRYYCSAKRERGTCDSTVGISAADLEGRVLDGLRSILLGQESLIEEFTTAFKAELARLRRTRHRRDRDLSKDLAKVERGIRRCLDFIAEGDGDPASVGPMLKAFEAQKRDLVAQINNTPGDAIVDLHPNIAELYRRKVTALQELLSDEETRVEAMETIRSLIDRIEVRARASRGFVAAKSFAALSLGPPWAGLVVVR